MTNLSPKDEAFVDSVLGKDKEKRDRIVKNYLEMAAALAVTHGDIPVTHTSEKEINRIHRIIKAIRTGVPASKDTKKDWRNL